MTLEGLIAEVKTKRTQAQKAFTSYARINCKRVPEHEVEALRQALGEISFGEAVEVLERIERQLTPAAGPTTPPTQKEKRK